MIEQQEQLIAEMAVENAELREELKAKEAELERVRAALEEEEHSHAKTADDRDSYHDQADALAMAISELTGVDIGEHSSANNPWAEALVAIDEYKAALASPASSPVECHQCAVKDAELERVRSEAQMLKRLVESLARHNDGDAKVAYLNVLGLIDRAALASPAAGIAGSEQCVNGGTCGAGGFCDECEISPDSRQLAIEGQHPCCWAPSKALKELERGMNNAPCILTDSPAEFNDTPLYRDPAGTIAALERENAELREALIAIKARIKGEFDHPALLKLGALGEIRNDVERIIDSALASPAAEPATDTDVGTKAQQLDIEDQDWWG